MAVIGKNEEPETWLNPEFPRLKDIRSFCPRKRESRDVPYSQILGIIKQDLRPQERLIITRRLLPQRLRRSNRKTLLNPTANQVWHYGTKIRLRPNNETTRWSQKLANDLEFTLHSQTHLALVDARATNKNNLAWIGFHRTTDDYRSIFQPLLSNIKGKELANLLLNFPEESYQRFSFIPGLKAVLSANRKDTNNENNQGFRSRIKRYGMKSIGAYGTESVVQVPSRTENKTQVVTFRHLPVRGQVTYTQYSSPIVMSILGSCGFSRFNIGLHQRNRKAEEVMCTHAVAAIDLDKAYREVMQIEVKNSRANLQRFKEELPSAEGSEKQDLEKRLASTEAFIEEYEDGTTPYYTNADLTYSPGLILTALSDLLSRRVTIADEHTKRERTLNEVEKEILLTQDLIDSTSPYHVLLNSGLGCYIQFVDRPFDLTFEDIINLSEESYKENVEAVYGP